MRPAEVEVQVSSQEASDTNFITSVRMPGAMPMIYWMSSSASIPWPCEHNEYILLSKGTHKTESMQTSARVPWYA